MKAIIHVNRHHIAANAKDNGNRPVFTIKQGGKTIYASSLKINGPSEFIYDTQGLSCGAKAYIVTESELELTNEMTFQEARQKQ